MANELRKYHAFVGGLIEDNPLTSGATTLTSAGLAAIVGGVASTEHMAIVLDPDGLNGAPEIAWITALTAGTGSGTIARGKEGTTAREHNRDISWVHATTHTDANRTTFKQTRWAGAGADLSIASSTMTTIDGTNIPALGLTLAVGDVVDLEFTATWGASGSGTVMGFDWLIDQPVSADTNLRGSGYGAFLKEWAATADLDANTATARGWFVATEAGTHTFLPQWRSSGGTKYIRLTGTYYSPVFHRVSLRGLAGN